MSPLTASTTVNGTLALTSGDLITGANTVTQPATTPISSTGTGDVVGTVIRSGTFVSGTAYTFGNPSNQIARTGGTSPTSISVKLVKSVPAAKANAVTRTYTVTPTGGSGYTATVRLHYLDAELNGNLESALELWHLSGTWTSQGQDSRDATANWVEKTGVALATLSGDWTIAGLRRHDTADPDHHQPDLVCHPVGHEFQRDLHRDRHRLGHQRRVALAAAPARRSRDRRLVPDDRLRERWRGGHPGHLTDQFDRPARWLLLPVGPDR